MLNQMLTLLGIRANLHRSRLPAKTSRLSHRSRRLTIDNLEQRMLFALVNWDGGGDGSSWSDPVNWSVETLPGVNDYVVINVTGTITVQHSSGNDIIRSLSSAENLAISGGSLTFSVNSSVGGKALLRADAFAGLESMVNDVGQYCEQHLRVQGNCDLASWSLARPQTTGLAKRTATVA